MASASLKKEAQLCPACHSSPPHVSSQGLCHQAEHGAGSETGVCRMVGGGTTLTQHHTGVGRHLRCIIGKQHAVILLSYN